MSDVEIVKSAEEPAVAVVSTDAPVVADVEAEIDPMLIDYSLEEGMADVEAAKPHWIKTMLGGWGAFLTAISTLAPIVSTIGVNIPLADVQQIGVWGAIMMSAAGTAVGAGMMIVAKSRQIAERF